MPLILAIVAVLAALWVFLWIRGSMDVDNVIDSYNHEEGRKQAAWEKAYNAALDRWDDMGAPERARLIDEWITNNNGTDSIVAVLSKFGDGWRERLCLVAEDIESKASEAWATEQARAEVEDGR